jgi:hypothetical protein
MVAVTKSTQHRLLDLRISSLVLAMLRLRVKIEQRKQMELQINMKAESR